MARALNESRARSLSCLSLPPSICTPHLFVGLALGQLDGLEPLLELAGGKERERWRAVR